MNTLQIFAEADKGYSELTASTARAMAGKDILLAVYNSDGTKLLAISGQQGLTINRSADSIEITSKDTEGGWKSKIAGMKEWSIDNDGLYVPADESHDELSKAFENSEPVCLKIVNNKTKKGMFGGMAVITDYPLEAPFDDAVTYSLAFEGMGALVDLQTNPIIPDTMPDGHTSLAALTIVSLAGESAGYTALYVNPTKENGNVYKYKVADSLTSPTFNEDCSELKDWDGVADIEAVTGKKILVVECSSDFKALKAGSATVTSMEG